MKAANVILVGMAAAASAAVGAACLVLFLRPSKSPSVPVESLAAIMSRYRAQKTLALEQAGQERLYRGRSASYWTQRVKAGDFHFGAWMGTLAIADGSDDNGDLLPNEEMETGAIVPLFADLLEDDDPFVRATGAFGLGTYGHCRHRDLAVAALVLALEDQEEDVQEEAAGALSRYDDLQLEPAVERVVEQIGARAAKKGPISFGASSLTDAEMEQMRGWTHLRALNASNTEITDDGLACLEELKGLAFLRLADTRVTDAGLVHLRGLTNLQELDLTGTAVTDEGADDLQQVLPQLKIFR
jgi:Leucine Rich Repeat (LRR) protein